MNQASGIADFLVETRTAPLTEQYRENLEPRQIWMAEFRDMPSQVEIAHLDRSLFNDFSSGGLLGLLRQHHWRKRLGFCLRISVANLLDDLRGPYIAGNHIKNIVGRILLLVIGPDITRL